MKEQNEVILSLGSNIGDRKENLEQAIAEIEQMFNSHVECSPTYQSEAWGFEANELFLNCCAVFKTDLSPNEVLNLTQSIELKLGRVKKSKNNNYESRLIDLDILYFNSQILKSEKLTIPHPLIYFRMFVVKPLSDIRPLFVDPIKNMTIQQLLIDCNDDNRVILYTDNK